VQERIIAAKFDQKMRKRAKGLSATSNALIVTDDTTGGKDVVGYEFTEQSTTSALDEAREAFVQEQIERIRRGEEPVVRKTPVVVGAQIDGGSKFVSAGFGEPASSSSPQQSLGRDVAEIALPASEAQLVEAIPAHCVRPFQANSPVLTS